MNGIKPYETEYFECTCTSNEHTLRVTLDEEDKCLYVSMFLSARSSFFKRLWAAAKYVLGYKCRYGHWEETILEADCAPRLREMLEKIQ